MGDLNFEFINPMTDAVEWNASVKNEPAETKETEELKEETKCGEIFALDSGNFVLICGFCHGKYDQMLDFGNHVKEEHEDKMTIRTNCKQENPITKIEDEFTNQQVDSLHKLETVPDAKVDGDPGDTENSSEGTPTSRRKPKKPQKFACNSCGQTYKHKASLHTHQNRTNCKRNTPEPKDSANFCPLCKKSFKSLVYLNKHNRRFHGQGSRLAWDQMTPKSADVKHEKSDNNCDNLVEDSSYVHDSIPEVIDEANKLADSMEDNCWSNDFDDVKDELSGSDVDTSGAKPDNKTQLKEFQCEHCNRVFKSKRSLSFHMNRQHDEVSNSAKQEGQNPQLLRCKYCNQEFSTKAECGEHENTHVGEKRFICWYCPHKFRTNYGRKRHMRVHTGERPYKCTECPKAFPHMVQLDYHIRKHKNLREFSCKTCGKEFFRKFELSLHERRHTGFRPLVCEDCGKTFNVMSELNEHRKRHTDVKDWKCEVCGKCFYSKWTLKDHMAGHSGETPFGCEVCGRKFSRSKALKKHKKLHSDVKAYVCNICGKAYAQDSGLYAHKKTHGIRNTHSEAFSTVNKSL